jgi:hypothetical protein
LVWATNMLVEGMPDFWFNCHQVFMIHNLVIGGLMRLNLKNTLAIILLMISMAFMPNSLWAEETPLDESATLACKIYKKLIQAIR